MTLLLAYMPGLVLTLVRVVSMIVAMMFLGNGQGGRMSRLVLAVAISIALFARAPVIVGMSNGAELAFLVAREAMLGFALGFAVQVVFATLRMTGSVIGHEMGFSMAQVVDPTSGLSTPVVGRLFETIATLWLLAVDGHHAVFRLLSDCFDEVPVGRAWSLDGVVRSLWRLCAEGITLALSLATPVYAGLILVTIVLVVLARAVPQVHLLEFGYAARILMALGLMAIYMTTAGPRLYRLFENMLGGVREMVRAAAM